MGMSAKDIADRHNAQMDADNRSIPPPPQGHNSVGVFATDQLKAIVERVERLEEEKKALADDIRDVYAEGKAHGFDAKALRAIVRERKQDADERKEQEAILDCYRLALGMLG